MSRPQHYATESNERQLLHDLLMENGAHPFFCGNFHSTQALLLNPPFFPVKTLRPLEKTKHPFSGDLTPKRLFRQPPSQQTKNIEKKKQYLLCCFGWAHEKRREMNIKITRKKRTAGKNASKRENEKKIKKGWKQKIRKDERR